MGRLSSGCESKSDKFLQLKSGSPREVNHFFIMKTCEDEPEDSDEKKGLYLVRNGFFIVVAGFAIMKILRIIS